MSDFKAGRFNLKTDKKIYIMGILNVTPDSFSDGGLYSAFDDALRQTEKMIKDGADIIDIGAVSTRPFSEKVSVSEECKRLERILPAIIGNFNVPVSVDTFNPETARMCLDMGADIINDVSGVFNQLMADVIKNFNCGWITMHGGVALRKAEAVVDYENGIVADVNCFFSDFIKKAQETGIDTERICLDPGFGFSKNFQQNVELLDNFDMLSSHNLPLLCALSRKRFIGELSGEEKPENRDNATLEANLRAIHKGASVIRVHNVAMHSAAIRENQ